MSDYCLVTGSNGFVGAALFAEMSKRSRHGLTKLQFRGAVRLGALAGLSEPGYVRVSNLEASTSWQEALVDVKVVVHTAARAHILKEISQNPLAEFRRINVDGTLNLAEQALRAGAHRFVYISSIGVNGNQTFGLPFNESSAANPLEPYAISNFEAEVGLRSLFKGSQTQLVIIRPPLVYGPNPPGNFRRLLQWVASGVPLPLGATYNKRSLVALDNLVDFIATCIEHPSASNQTFLVSDGDDLSTTELLKRMGAALGKPARLVPVPLWMLTTGAVLSGNRALSQQLCGSLQVDIEKVRNVLGWSPPLTVDEGLRAVAKHFLATKGCR
jgi:nucleoside-diphosphate-sugar epimerase